MPILVDQLTSVPSGSLVTYVKINLCFMKIHDAGSLVK